MNPKRERKLKKAERVDEFFFIFNQGEVLWSNVFEKLRRRRCCLCSALCGCFVLGTSGCRKTPFIDIWPDLVKPFLKAKSITRYVIYDCGTTTLDARGGVGRRSQVGGAGWREGGVDVKPITRIVIVNWVTFTCALAGGIALYNPASTSNEIVNERLIPCASRSRRKTRTRPRSRARPGCCSWRGRRAHLLKARNSRVASRVPDYFLTF